MMVQFSVGLPFYRSKYVGWLALESLCRQEDVDFEWELFVMEEVNDESLGEETVRSYEERLKAVGCVSFNYIRRDKWVPLGQKLKDLIALFSDSEVAIWNPDDYYAPPKLLSNSYNILTTEEHFDWYSIPQTIFYNIANGQTIVYDVLSVPGRRTDDTTGRAFKTPLLKAAANNFVARRSGCDGMLRDNMKKVLRRPINFYFDSSDIWKYGLNTKGLNNISHWQARWFNSVNLPFRKCEIDIKNTIPEDIMNRLIGSRKYIKLHKKGVG